MPKAVVSGQTWDLLKSLFKSTRRGILKSREALSALHLLTNEACLSHDFIPHVPSESEIRPSDNHLDDLAAFIRDQFPPYDLSTQGSWCSYDSPIPPAVPDLPLEIHGRIVAALNLPQSERNVSRLQFVVIVIILHRLAHIIGTEFNHGYYDGLSDGIKPFPFYESRFKRGRKDEERPVPEPGFLGEEAVFGGIVGIVFRDEMEDGFPPRLLHADFTRIEYLVLHCRDGQTYQLDNEEIRQRVKRMDFRPFDISRLTPIRRPRRMAERLCAFYNGDHIPIEFPGEGANIPRPNRESRSLTPSDSYGSRRGSPEPTSARRRSRYEGDNRGEEVHHEPVHHAPEPMHERQESATTDTSATTNTTDMGLPRDGSQTPRDSLDLEREHRQSRGLGMDEWEDLGDHRGSQGFPSAVGAEGHEPRFDDLYESLPPLQQQQEFHDWNPDHDIVPGMPPSVRFEHHEPEPIREPTPEPTPEPLAEPDPEVVTVPEVIPQVAPPSTRGKGKKLKRRGG